MGLGSNVEKLMQARGFSYPDVARGIGIEDVQAIWALVHRKSKKSQFAGKLATFFGVPLERLMAEDFEVDEKLSNQDLGIKANKPRAITPPNDAEKLLVLLKTFLDTNSQGKLDLLHAAEAVIKHRGTARQPQSRRTKRR